MLSGFPDCSPLCRTYYFLTWTDVGGMLGWANTSSPGVEFKGFTAVNASYTTARWALTYTPQPVRQPPPLTLTSTSLTFTMRCCACTR